MFLKMHQKLELSISGHSYTGAVISTDPKKATILLSTGHSFRGISVNYIVSNNKSSWKVYNEIYPVSTIREWEERAKYVPHIFFVSIKLTEAAMFAPGGLSDMEYRSIVAFSSTEAELKAKKLINHRYEARGSHVRVDYLTVADSRLPFPRFYALPETVVDGHLLTNY